MQLHVPSRSLPDLPSVFDAAYPAAAKLLAALQEVLDRHVGLLWVDLRGQAVSGHLLRWFLTEAINAGDIPIRRVNFFGANVSSNLDISGATLQAIPAFHACDLAGGLNVRDARLPGLEIIAGSATLVRAERLRAEGSVLIRTFLRDLSYSYPTDEARQSVEQAPPAMNVTCVILHGAQVGGNLDLRGAHIQGTLTEGAAPRRVALAADGIRIEGNLELGDAELQGEACLNGCRLARNIHAAGTSIINPEGRTLALAGADVSGSVDLVGKAADHGPHGEKRRRFVSIGRLFLDGGRIAGDLRMIGAHLTAGNFAEGAAPSLPWTGDRLKNVALDATGLHVGASIEMRKFELKGAMRLNTAQIGDRLECTRSILHFPGEIVLDAAGATVSGRTCFADNTVCNGLITLARAELKQGCEFRDVKFRKDGHREDHAFHTPARQRLQAISPGATKATGFTGLYAEGTKIGASFRWSGIRCDGPSEQDRRTCLYLSDAHVNILEEDQHTGNEKASWLAMEIVDLRGFHCDSISGLAENQKTWRLKLIDTHHATGPDVFAPGPYLELARAFRIAGFDTVANEVLLRLERVRTRCGTHSFWQKIPRHALGITLGYGYRPMFAVYMLLGWAVVSTAVFHYTYNDDVKCDLHKPVSPAFWGRNLRCVEAEEPKPSENTTAVHAVFRSPLYAADSLVPFVHLGQRSAFLPERTWSAAGVLVLINAVLGPVFTALLAAVAGGLVKKEK